MTTINVTCATQDTDGDITGIGGNAFYHTKSEAIFNIKYRNYEYFVNNTTKVIIKTRDGNDYLTTLPDGEIGNNLDEIKSCNI